MNSCCRQMYEMYELMKYTPLGRSGLLVEWVGKLEKKCEREKDDEMSLKKQLKKGEH